MFAQKMSALLCSEYQQNLPIPHHPVFLLHQLPHLPAIPSTMPPWYVPAAYEVITFTDQHQPLSILKITGQVNVAAILSAGDHMLHWPLLQYHCHFCITLLVSIFPSLSSTLLEILPALIVAQQCTLVITHFAVFVQQVSITWHYEKFPNFGFIMVPSCVVIDKSCFFL